jgi:hypothetical protein
VLIQLLIFLILLPFSIEATVFQLQPVSQQIQEADGIIIGHYLRKKSIRMEDGSIATQMIFKMNKEIGMQSDLFKMDEVIIHYPGGQIGEEIVKVEGAPSFIPGESAVIMIKGHQDRFWGMNLGFGAFKVISYGKETMIVNNLFPEDPKDGQIKLEEFERKVREIKGEALKIVQTQIHPSEESILQNDGRAPASLEEEGKNRAIASKSVQEENEGGPQINILWLLLILALMGGGFRFFRQKEAKS